MTMDPVHERVVRHQVTPAERLSQQLRNVVSVAGRLVGFVVLVTPLLLTAILTLDIQVRAFDLVFTSLFGIRPSEWLSWGRVILGLVPLLAILYARRFGGREASRGIILSWFMVAMFVLFELSVLSSVIEAGDFPGSKFIIAVVAGAMSGQLVAVAFYDIVRGGGQWWRAPLYSALLGYFVSALLYFPIAYFGSGVAWMHWLVADLFIMVLMGLIFLPFYAFFRKSLRPQGGYGGR